MLQDCRQIAEITTFLRISQFGGSFSVSLDRGCVGAPPGMPERPGGPAGRRAKKVFGSVRLRSAVVRRLPDLVGRVRRLFGGSRDCLGASKTTISADSPQNASTAVLQLILSIFGDFWRQIPKCLELSTRSDKSRFSTSRRFRGLRLPIFSIFDDFCPNFRENDLHAANAKIQK